MNFIDRFTNINIELNTKLVDSFINKIKNNYSYEWVSDKEYKTLVIHGEKEYSLPFKEVDNGLILTLHELTTKEKSFSLAFNQLLFEARKKMMGIESIFERKRKRVEKRKNEIASIQQKRKQEALHRTVAPLTKQTEEKIKKLEIDYVLMELHEAMTVKNEEQINSCKKRLQELVEQKNGDTSVI